jgi:hypothetical protein
MRIYGRTRDTLTGEKTWTVVTTDPGSFDDMVYLVNLIQVCKLNLEESPFFADWGIPAYAAVMFQVPPDYYVALTQQRFAQRFMSLSLARFPDAVDASNRPMPHYRFVVVTNWGATLAQNVPM